MNLRHFDRVPSLSRRTFSVTMSQANMQFDSSSATQMARETGSWLNRILVGPWKRMLRHRGMPTLQYLLKTEAHTFAFSVAANAILSFFPFMVLIMWLIRNVFHSSNMQDVVVQLLRDHLPAGQDFVTNKLMLLVRSR